MYKNHCCLLAIVVLGVPFFMVGMRGREGGLLLYGVNFNEIMRALSMFKRVGESAGNALLSL